MELIDMFAVIIAGIVIAAGELCTSYALCGIGIIIVILGPIYINMLESDIS